MEIGKISNRAAGGAESRRPGEKAFKGTGTEMKAKQTLIAGVVLSALAAMAQSALAEETVTSQSVKVTASRVEQELQDVNMSVSVVTAEDIEKSDAKTIGDLLKDVPGVRVNNDGSQGMKRVSIRGEDSFRTLVLIDGQKISEHKSMSGSPMLIDPSAVERIEVIKGPTSVLYGSDAIGGVVNIITKKGGQKAFQADVSVGGDTASYGRTASASVSGQANGWHYRVGAAYEKGEDLRTPAGRMVDKTSGGTTAYETKNANLFVAYDINANNQVGITLDHHDLEFHSISYGYDGFAVNVPSWKRTKAGAFWESKKVSEYLTRLRVDAYYQKSHKKMQNVMVTSYIDTTPEADNTIDQYGFSAQADWQLGDSHTLITGYEYEYDDLDAVSTSKSHMHMSPMMNYRYQRVTPYNGSFQSHAIFGAMESTFGDFVLNYGARYTYVKTDMKHGAAIRTDLDAHGSYQAGQVTPVPEYDVKANSGHDDKVVFNAGLLYKGIQDWTLRASWAQGFRAPILQERYVDTIMGSMSGSTYGNPDLKPETSNNFELGARYLKGGASFDAAAFLSLADDYIATVPYKTSGSYRYDNIAKAKSYGIELSASYAIEGTGFEPYANFTWLRRQYDNGRGYKTYDTGTPQFWARYGVRYRTDWNGYLFRSDVYAMSQSASKYRSSTGSSDYRYGGATTLNVTAGVSFGPEKAYRLDAGVYNIFDKLYQNSGAVYEPGRYAAVKFSATF